MQVQEPVRQNQARPGLYESVNRVIWVLEIKGIDTEQEDCVYTLTATAVHPNGYLLTCAHGDWHELSDRTIRARPLCGFAGFKYHAEVIVLILEADLCLLKLDCEVHETFVAEFGSGDLSVGDRILMIGHPEDLVGTGTIGTVAYPCFDNALPGLDTQETCRMYDCTAASHTPPYRIMGHEWNKLVFEYVANVEGNYEFQKNLLAKVPIIQCSNLVGGPGASGGPIFNSKGQIVGMMVGDSGGYSICIHVAAIKQFLKKYLEESLEKIARQKEEEGGEGSGGKTLPEKSKNQVL